MQKAQWMAVIWPAFLGAAVLEMLVFAMVDPAEFHLPFLGQRPSTMATYTGAFFVFWIGTMVTGILTAVLSRQSNEVNDTQ